MDRKIMLQKLLCELEKIDNLEYRYLGTGNPDADILIIGKEASIKEIESEQYKIEIKNNYSNWKELSNKYQTTQLCSTLSTNYSPLFPYKGQQFKIDNGNNRGTSRTWYTYQKLINFIFNKPQNNAINFHKNVFITEVNSTPSRQTKNAKKSSIQLRKETILSSEFIRSFPVVIISGVGYFKIDEYENEIENIFKVKFHEKMNAIGNSQPYWIHFNQENHPQKILLNCHQLSIGIADELLIQMANHIKTFLNKS